MNGVTPAQTFDIALFGGLVIRDRQGNVVELAGQKDRALLGFLALSPGTPHGRDKLAALLWGESGHRQARDSLKQAVLRLRRAFGSAASSPLIARRHTVALAEEAVSVDVGWFESLLGRDSPDSAEAAIALYRGDLLDGIRVREAGFEDWLLVERQRLRDMAVDASAMLMVRMLNAGQRDRAAAAARRLLSFDPLHEAACRTLMQVHSERGERAQALKLFETLRDRLQQDLAVAPEPATAELYQAIRARRGPGVRPEAAEPPQEELRTPRPASVVVLPFTNIGDDPEQEYFADGLTEDIITDLSKVSALAVVARHTAFTYKNRPTRVREVAEELNVAYVLEGSVRKAAGRVRINAQLIDGATGNHLWANRYDRDLHDIFALQDEITEGIVNALKVRLLPGEQAGLGSHTTSNVDAWQYYLMGRSFYLRGLNKHSLRIAGEMFARAIAIDPGYARAYAASAIVRSYLSIGDPEAPIESGLEEAARALTLDPDLAEGHAAMGLALYAAGRYTEATPAFERAAELDPNLYEPCFFHARNCRLQGLHEQAAALLKRAAALRPEDFRSQGLLASEYRVLGREQEFTYAVRRCVERIEAEIEAHPDNADALAFGSFHLVDLGRPERARDWAERALMIAPEDKLVLYNVARTWARLGDAGKALDCLEQTFSLPGPWQRRLASWMKHDEEMDALRFHPGFAALTKRLDART
jgi:adenylate cyclase